MKRVYTTLGKYNNNSVGSRIESEGELESIEGSV